jgi:eukaryotic-like serine/threonine-protein kinase
LDLTPGARLGPYEIVTRLGEGGMGEVYKALDTRLDRIVAVKVSKTAFDPRFDREARSIAALNHAHICTLYDVGPDYLVMEYIEGAPLQGPLTLEAGLRVGLQIAGALEAAHARGILHRDLKPANILVTASGAKLLDFGLARMTRLGSDDATGRTMDGTVLGTAAYMSPEQAQGKPLDERSDIFSFGAVLYELLSGQRAFRGGSMAEVLSAVMRDEPAPLASPLAPVVSKCLAKMPGQRYTTMADVRAALERTTAAPQDRPPSIAVLPFVNMSADKEQEYFSDGLTEEIINLLAQTPGLKVIARTSAFAFRGKEQDIRAIAAALGVGTVLEGSVRRAGSRIRVTAQLISADDGSHLFSERYDREMADVFAMQDEIAAAIATALRIKLSSEPAPQRHMPKVPAYDAYLKALYHQAKVRPESLDAAKRYLESAIEIDPEFALAHVGLGVYWFIQTVFGRCRAHEAVPAARAEIQRALQIDGSLPEAHALLGHFSAFYDLDWDTAERHFEVPMARQAGFGLMRPIYSGFQFLRGNIEHAIELAARAIADDPLEVWPRMNQHAYLQAAGRDREAYAQTLKVLELDGNLVIARVSIAHFHAAWDELAEAVTAARQAYAVGPWYPDAIATLAAVLRLSGNEAEARALYTKLGTGAGFGDCRAQAAYYLLCGDVNQGADWVEKAIAERDHSMMFYLRMVICRPLKASHRWPAIARMINLPA